jgi:hypothetical protein
MFSRKPRKLLAILWRALLLGCLGFSQIAFAFTPEQTVNAWISALKRNDVKAAMLLGTTPEEYLELSKDLSNDYLDTPESNASFATDFADLLAPDASARIFAQVQPSLALANVYRDSFAGMADGLLQEFGSNGANSGADSELTPDQLAAAQEVLQAFKAWAMRTDFSDEKRARASIDAVVSAFRAAKVESASDWAKLSDDARVAKLNFALQAVKGIFKSYDLDIDKLLASVIATAGKQTAEASEVRIGFKVFEARGSSMFKMYQRSGEWFFWENSIMH